MEPSVSIVIINYNYEDFLAEAIDSALTQSQPADQILVVDDGSTDDSRTVIEGFSEQVETCFKENGGQPSAYNAALPLVKTDVVLILDSDDLLEPECVETLRKVWKPDITKIQFPLTYINGEGTATGGATPRVHHVGNLRDIAIRFGGYASPPSSGNAYCRKYLETIFPLSEESKYSADCIPITLAPCYGEVIGLEESLGRHRVHQSQSSSAPGEGLNHVHEPGWLRRSVLRDYEAYVAFTEHLEKQDGIVLSCPSPKVPALLRTMAVHQIVDPPLPGLGGGRRLSLRGIKSSLQYPDYSVRDRCLLLVWFVFLLVTPSKVILFMMKKNWGLNAAGLPNF